MKTNIGLLVGGLVLILGSTAGAASLPLADQCGAVGSTTGSNSVAFTVQANGAIGTATTSGGSGIITCNAYTVPAGETLTQIVIEVTDDAQQPASATSEVSWTWSYTSGAALTPVPSGAFDEAAQNGGASFGNCATFSGTPTLACDSTATFNLVSNVTGNNSNQFGPFTLSVTPTSVGGDNGVGLTGSDSAQVFVEFLYVPTSTLPEPASLVLVGSGLIGLGVFARRKRQR